MARPGEWLLSDQPIEINAGRRTCKLKVRNTGDRPIQIGSHYHFFEVNRALHFDRAQAIGMHLNIPGGLAVRFEPGDEKEVELVEFGGTKQVVGFNNLVDGGMTAQSTVRRALRRARDLGFLGVENSDPGAATGLRREDGEGQDDGRGHKQDNESTGREEGKS